MTATASADRPREVNPILFFVGVTIAAIIGQTWWAITQDRQLTLDSEKASGLATVRILEEHATQTFQDAEHMIDLVASAVHASDKNVAADEQAIRDILKPTVGDYRHIRSMQYVNLQGQSWITSRDYPSHMADVSDRQYIRFLLNHPEHTQSVIGHPFKSNYDSQLVVPIGRNLYDRRGRHVGIVSVDIPLSYFANIYAKVAKDSNAMVSLFADAGFIIVRSPFEARYVDRDISGYPVLKQLRTAPVEGSFEDDSLLDDEVPRLYIYRKSSDFPITTAFGRDFDSILAAWHSRTANRILFSGVIIVFITALTYFLIIHIKRLHRSEESLRNSENKFATIFQRSPVPLALVRLENDQFVEINDFWAEHFGYRRDEVVGRTALELNVWTDPAERQPIIDRLLKQNYVDRAEARFSHKDGRVFVCLLSGRLFDSLGEKMFIFSLADITRQRAIESEIRELNQQLEERVRLRTLKLEQTNRELSDALASLNAMQDELIRTEKMAALGSLVAGVSHELNTPIGTSVTVASTLWEHTDAMLREVRSGNLRRSRFDQFLNDVASGANLLLDALHRASELVSSFKQVAVDQSSNQSRRFDLKAALQEIVATLAPLYKKTPYTLELTLAPDITLDSYPGPLGQVITNFVTNALTHAFEGRPHGSMRLATRLYDAEHAEITFSDDGIGIPPENQKRVFDPFFTTKLGQGGSGLGMNIVYNLVTGVLGGKVHLHSTPGAGTTLTLILPLRAPRVPDDAQ